MADALEARDLVDRAQEHVMRGEDAEGIPLALRSLEVYTSLHDTDGIGRVCNLLGVIMMNAGDLPKAFEYYQRALDAATQKHNDHRIAATLHNIGMTLDLAADYAGALEYYHRARSMNESIGDLQHLANNLAAIAGSYRMIDDHQRSLEAYDQALDLYEQIGDRHGVGNMLENLGTSYSIMADFDKAEQFRRRAIEELSVLDDVPMLHKAITDLAKTMLQLGRMDEAIAYRDQARTLPITRPLQQISAVDLDALIHVERGELDEADQCYATILDLIENHGLRFLEVDIRKQLRDLALRRNDLAAYVKHNDAVTAVTAETKGNAVAVKIAMQDTERRLAQERQAHERQLAVLHATLPKEIADRVARGETVSDHFDHAAVLFTDVVGFTSHASELPGSVVTALLEELFRVFDSACKQYGVTKVKTIGDAYLCFAGSDIGEQISDIGHEQRTASPEQRVAAVAIAMQQAEFYWPSATANSNSNRIQFRIGIHSGPVTAGVIGTERLQYDIWGDTVNMASRMESTGEAGRIQVSESFAAALRDGERISDIGEDGPISDPRYPILRERGAIEIKGKGLVTTYWLE